VSPPDARRGNGGVHDVDARTACRMRSCTT
jgi:hypothetical protein